MFGFIGAAKALNYGGLVPKFNAVLATLGQFEFGSSKRLNSESM
jgi:hypothetical protein